MNELTLKLVKADRLGYYVALVDGKEATFKKNEFGNFICKHNTQNENVKISIKRYIDCGGVLWFLAQLFFFIISFFGLFDVRAKRKYIALDFEMQVEMVEDTQITLNFTPLSLKKNAVEVESTAPVQVGTNEYLINDKAKKIFKILIVAKIITAIALVAAAVMALLSAI